MIIFIAWNLVLDPWWKIGKLKLMHYVHYVSSYLPPLDGVDASNVIDIGWYHLFWGGESKKKQTLNNANWWMLTIGLLYTTYFEPFEK